MKGRRQRRYLQSSIGAALLVAIGSGCAAHGTVGSARPSGNDERVARIHAFADSVVRSVPVAGMSIVVTHGARTVMRRGYGVADVSTGRATTDTTAYRIGSLTKSFTAAAIFKLVEQGRLTLDDPLRKYLPDYSTGEVTIRQALNHTSGLPEYEGKVIERWLTARLPITNEYVASTLRELPARPAGRSWNYNNTGFHLLGLVLEKITGTPYHDVVGREITRPLGLRATWMEVARPSDVDQSLNYYLVHGRPQRDSVWDLPGIFSAGGMFSSAWDLATFMRALADGRVVGRSSVVQMTRPTTVPDGARADYGFGLRLGMLDGHRKWGHTGSARSNRAAAAYYPDDSLTVVVLMNTEHEDLPISAIDIEGRIARTMLGLPAVAARTLPLPAKATEIYAGVYADANTRSRIVEKDGALELSRVGSTTPPIAMLYQGADEWVPDGAFPAFRFVFQRQGGRAVAIARYDNGWFVGVRPRIE
jgi:CubicO group peptidase (beta-lactamase class C family)